MITETDSPRPTLDDSAAAGRLREIVGLAEQREACNKLAFVFGSIGFFGLADAVIAIARRGFDLGELISVVASAGMLFAGIMAWREARRPGPSATGHSGSRR